MEVTHLGLRGELLDQNGLTATIQAGRVTVRVPVDVLRVVGERRAVGRAPIPRRDNQPDKSGTPTEIHLLGRTTEEARALVEKYLDDAFLAGLPSIRLIHGKGTGALRKAVHELLGVHPLVASFRPGESWEGGSGATVVELGID